MAGPFASKGSGVFSEWIGGQFWKRMMPWFKTSAIISAEMWLGDLACQSIESRGKEWAVQRSNTMAMTGFASTGPLVHWLVCKLEKIAPGSHARAVLTKVGLNCLFMPVMFGVSLACTSLLQGNGIQGARIKLQDELGPIVLEGIAFWPAANLLLYRFIPARHIVLASSAAGATWSVALSIRAFAPSQSSNVEHIAPQPKQLTPKRWLSTERRPDDDDRTHPLRIEDSARVWLRIQGLALNF